MADYALKPPKERKKRAGLPASPDCGEGDICIMAVDRGRNTIRLQVNDCPVTLTCAPESNLDTYQRVKSILLDTVVEAIPQKVRKI